MKVLIIRFSSIGDIVLCSPVIRLAKTKLKAEVHFITKSQYAQIVENNPYIDKVFTIDSKVSEVTEKLKQENYNYIIDLHNNIRSFQVKIALKKKTFTFKKENFKKWLMVNLKTNHNIPHIVERYVETLKKLNIKNDNLGLDFYFKPDFTIIKKFNIPDSYIVISLGAKHYTKQIPEDLLVKILENINLKSVFIGGKDVSDLAKRLNAKFPGNTINLAGKISLHNSAQLIDKSKILLTSDTGMMHIGAALKKPMVVVWGSTVPQFGMYPYYGSKKQKYYNCEIKNLKCRPCSKIGYDKCPKSHFKCMAGHDPLLIADKLIELSD